MDLQLLLSFIAASVLLALMPGPDNIYVLTESVANGAKRGVIITAGLVSGVVVHTFLAATGLSLIIYSSELVYNLVLYAGSAYLFYLSYMATKETPIDVDSNKQPTERTTWSLFKQGVLMNVLNPKVSLFFIALLPRFVSDTGWSPMLQMSLLGSVFMVQAFVVFSSVALIAGSLANLVENPTFWKVTKWLKVIVLAALGLFLLF